jgi:hypothetical protein
VRSFEAAFSEEKELANHMSEIGMGYGPINDGELSLSSAQLRSIKGASLTRSRGGIGQRSLISDESKSKDILV